VKKVQLNLIDKAIAFVNPQAAVERLASRAKLTAFEYDAVQYNRQRRGPSSLSGAEGFRSNYDRVELLKRSRDLAENVGLVRGLLMKFASHCAGNISYQARTESPKVNTDVEAYWNDWWDKCDLSGRHTGSFLMQIAMMSMLRDGDFLFVLVRSQDGTLKLQGIEADRLGDPNRTYTSLNLISGIHIDQETGSPVGYDIYLRTYGNAYIFQTTIPASQAFHLYDPLRIDQYRGVSAFHTAINDCVDIYEIIASEKMAAKYASSQAGIIKRNNNNASDLSTLTNDLNADNQGIKLETIEPGKVSYLEVNEDIIFPDGPSRPSGAFAEFHKILLRNICMGVGIPYSFAVDPSSMSGPTARLEMQQAGRTFRRYQKLLEDRVLRPLKNIVIADGVARGLIANNLGSKSTKGIFNFGANVSIDLGRESQANIAEFRAGLTSASSIYSEKGLDFESSMRQRALEAKLIDDLAKQYGVQPSAISDTVLGSIQQPTQDQSQAGDQTTQQSEQTYVADQALNGAQVASLIQVINAVASGAISKEGSVSIITSAFPFISPEEASKIVEGINIGTIAPSTKTPTPTQAIPEKMEDEPQDENAVVVVPPIKEQDTKSRTTGGDGDIDVGEVREPTEPGATEDTEKIGGKQIENNLQELSRLDSKSFEMISQAFEALANSRKKRNTFAIPNACPLATQDIKTNLKNRQTAVNDANYGPSNPNQPNDIYWKAKADEFQGDVATAKTMRCGNCAAFNQTSKILGCIKKGIGKDANEVAQAGDLGYCEIFDFKCAAKRTCDAWIAGGPLTDDKKKVTNFVAGRDCGQDDGGTFGPDNKCAVGYGRPKEKGGYTPTRPGGKIPKDYKRPTPQNRGSKKPLPPKPPALKPPMPPPPPPPPAGTKKPTQEKPAIKSKFPNATKAYDSKEKASLEPVIKENQKQLQAVRDKIIKGSSSAQKDVESQENKYQETKKNLSEAQQKFSELAKLKDEVAATDRQKYEEYKAQFERDYSKLQSLREGLRAQKQIVEDSRAKVREIGLKAIREDMLEINKQDGFSSEQLNKATEELKQKQQTAIATDKKSIRDSKDANAAQQREKAQDVLRSIFNPNTHDESLSKPITYSGASRAHSVGRTIEFVDGTRSANLTGIVINKQTTLSTILHEYGHQVENGSPEAHDLCSDFLKKRTSGEKVERYQRVFKGYGYGKDEEGSPDDFEKTFKAVVPEADTKNKAYYTGKKYKERPFGASSKYLASSEVYSMGIELLHENPIKFAQADPEWFDLVSGIATGRLLKKTRGLK
jgi:lambda family phage portal protein